MTDHSELIKKLRDLHRDPRPASVEWLFENQVALYDAAAAIEDMAKHITEMHERVTVLQIDRGHLETEVKEWRRLNNENLLPKRGEWEPFDLTWGRSIYSCTVCGEAADVPTANGKVLYNYCPNCGADMRKMEVQE